MGFDPGYAHHRRVLSHAGATSTLLAQIGRIGDLRQENEPPPRTERWSPWRPHGGVSSGRPSAARTDPRALPRTRRTAPAPPRGQGRRSGIDHSARVVCPSTVRGGGFVRLVAGVGAGPVAAVWHYRPRSRRLGTREWARIGRPPSPRPDGADRTHPPPRRAAMVAGAAAHRRPLRRLLVDPRCAAQSQDGGLPPGGDGAVDRALGTRRHRAHHQRPGGPHPLARLRLRLLLLDAALRGHSRGAGLALPQASGALPLDPLRPGAHHADRAVRLLLPAAGTTPDAAGLRGHRAALPHLGIAGVPHRREGLQPVRRDAVTAHRLVAVVCIRHRHAWRAGRGCA